MPNPILLVDTTGAILPLTTDFTAHLTDQVIDYYQFNSANITEPDAMFYCHSGMLLWKWNWPLPTKDTTHPILYRRITLQPGAQDCTLTNGYLGATNIRPCSVRFFVDVKCRFKLGPRVNGYDGVEPIPNQSDGTCWQEETRTLMIVDYGNDANGTGTLKAKVDDYTVDIGTIHYGSGTININTVTVTTDPAKANPGPEFSVTVAVGDTINTRLYSWSQLANLPVRTGVFSWIQWGILPQIEVIPVGTYAANVKYATGPIPHVSEGVQTVNVVMTSLGLKLPTAPNSPLTGVSFKVGNTLYTSLSDGTLVTDFNPVTGTGTTAGAVDLNTGAIQITNWLPAASAAVSEVHAAAPYGVEAYCDQITIRTASAPLRPGSLSIVGSTKTFAGLPHSFNVSADLDGNIVDDWVLGKVDYANGIVRLWFTQPVSDVGYLVNLNTDTRTKDYSFLEIPGVAKRLSWHAKTSSLRYNAVAYSYLPMDANLLGIDPVRLPSDGRVPIFRPGGFVVIGHTGEIEATVANGQTVNCARERLSRVRVVGHDGAVINTGYSTNLNAGTVTFSDVSGYSQPVKIQHRIEDMMMTSDVQINGQLTFTRPLTHDYPLGSYVSSALVVNDLRARVSVIFDQATWNGSTWADAVTGSAAVATFNDAQFPITVTNRGALTERWLVQFTNTTAFNVIGENVGVIASGNINTNCTPTNPATGVPYFTIPALGWGAGWSAGNVLRFNTVGSIFPIWCVRTIQQGPETVTNDNFTILIRGDIDTP